MGGGFGESQCGGGGGSGSGDGGDGGDGGYGGVLRSCRWSVVVSEEFVFWGVLGYGLGAVVGVVVVGEDAKPEAECEAAAGEGAALHLRHVRELREFGAEPADAARHAGLWAEGGVRVGGQRLLAAAADRWRPGGA